MPPTPRKEPARKPETTPVFDEVSEQLKTDLASADPADVTLFEEDEDPLSHVGDLVEDDDPHALTFTDKKENA